MKVGGKTLSGLATGTVTLPRHGMEDIVLTVYALPLGFEERAEGLFPSPVAPRQYVMGAGGRALRDPKTKKPLVEPNEEDPKYGVLLRRASRMQMVVHFYEAVKRGNVEFATTEPEAGAADALWIRFYEDAYLEIQQSGFTIGDLNLAFKEISMISNLGDDVIEGAAEDFLPEESEEGPVGMK